METVCEHCTFEDGRNFVILGQEIVYTICNIHIHEYKDLFCSDCELYHIEPTNQEFCARSRTIFVEWSNGVGDSDNEGNEGNEDNGDNGGNEDNGGNGGNGGNGDNQDSRRYDNEYMSDYD